MSKIQNEEAGMSFIVKTITRLIVGFILLFGIYIVLHGHVSPGGGFSGGLIIALSFISLMIAFGKETAMQKLSEARAAIVESIGALLFLSIAVFGFIGGNFFVNFFKHKGEPFSLFSAGSIPLANIAIATKVGVGLFSIFIVLVVLQSSKDSK